MAAAVVRVKRRIDEEQSLNAFVLNCKRRKFENNVTDVDEAGVATNNDEVSTIFKFAGTAKPKDSVVTQLQRLTKDDAKQLAQKNRPKPQSITKRGREEMRSQLHENRFKIVNCYRADLEAVTENENNESKLVTVVDIEDSNNSIKNNVTENNKTENEIKENDVIDEEEDYVYDLYLPEENEMNEQNLTEYLHNYHISIRPFDDFVYEDNFSYDDTDISEDSNREDYYTNDYPDEEDNSDSDSVGVDDMRRAVEDFDLDGERELSSDDENYYDNDFVHSVDSEGLSFDQDIDSYDVSRYQDPYKRYKSKFKSTDSDEDDSDIKDSD